MPEPVRFPWPIPRSYNSPIDDNAVAAVPSLASRDPIGVDWIRLGGVKSVLGSQAAARAHLMRLCDSHNDLGFMGHVIIVCPAILGEEVDCSMRMLCVICQGFSIMCSRMADDKAGETSTSVSKNW